MIDLSKRIDIVFLLDVQDGNPNGNPADSNRPRIDPHTGEGLISDACLKRVIRNYAEHQGQTLFITSGEALNAKISRVKKGATKDDGAKKLCSTYWDVRTFGAVAATGGKEDGKEEDAGGVGTIRGPMQVTFARSLHQVSYTSHQLTRCVDTKKDNLPTMTDGSGKHIVRYAVYRGVATFTPRSAGKTGFAEADLRLFLNGLLNGWQIGRSASKGLMGVRALRIAQHATEDGRAHIGAVVSNAFPMETLKDPPISWDEVQSRIAAIRPTNGVTWLDYSPEAGFTPHAPA